ncbi:MAG: beta strand repeat-containing protein [Gemmatimonadaceae bacterium]
MPDATPIRRLAVAAGLLIAVLVACGKEITGPVSSPVNVLRRVASFAFEPKYETAIPARALHAALQQVAFERVRITLRREDGSIALDTVVDFPAGADSLVLGLTVPLPPTAPSTGVALSLNLGYVNAAGDTVFKGGPFPVTVMPSTGGAPPAPVQVPIHYTGPGASAAAVAITPKTFSGTPGQNTTFTAQAFGPAGQQLPGTPIAFTSGNDAVVTINESTGAATLRGRGTTKVYALLLTGPADSAVVTVTLPASQLQLVSGGGQSAPAGATLAQPVIARVVASDGIGVSGVTVGFAASGGGTVIPATAISDASGNVSTQWKLGPTAGAQTLTVTSAGLTGSPLTVSATAQVITPTRLAVITQPASTLAGATINAVSVAAQDASGNTVTSFTGAVSVAIANNAGGATLSGTTTVNAVAGIATFSDLKLNRPGTGYTLVLNASGLTSATTSAFNITAGSAARLVVGAVPSSVDAGLVITPSITVTATDSTGNTVTSFTGAVTVAIGTNPGGGTLSGTLTRTAVAGVATFDNLSINRNGVGYTLAASATGLASGASVPFTVVAGPPTQMVLVSGGGQTALAGTALQPIVIRVNDAQGNGIGGIALTVAVASGGGSVLPTSATTDATGSATTAWTLGGASGTQTMTVSATGLGTLTVSATATGGSTNQLAISTPPTPTQVAGVTFSPAVVVQAKDALGVVQTGFTGAVTATVASGPAGAVLGGTTTVNAVAGVATFGALRLDKTGIYTLQFAATGYASAVTTNITVGPGAAHVISADSGNAQTGAAGAALPQKLVVVVTDSLGNPVSAVSVGWTVATGGGSISGQTTATDPNGRARALWTLGITPGAQSVTVTSTGLIGSPVTFTATAQGTIATTVVSPQLDTIVSLNATRTLTAQAKDGAGSNMTGTFTWASRTPSVATVNATGVVTSVGNGTAYIVATEAGGTKDSALIVVQQRVATINVTPGIRTIYKTRNYAFTASAVDGMGNVMPGITSFTWSTVTPSVASVDTAGKVTANALGSTQVRATAGAITGVATVNVLTPITRIIVGRDSLGVPVTDSTALTALGVGRFFRAEARDTLDAPMTGITFTWFSTNSSVALMDSISATRARALSNANGVTAVQATADGIMGSAALKVQQVLASIELGPTPDTIGISGTVQLTARGKDANNRYISGGTFTFASGTPAVATVNATSGVVTGVTLGSSNITATSGAITSNNAVVVVSTTVPAIISFGRDTLTVGRGASTSIPIFLSRPNASPVTINLAARDTNAYFSTASITIAAGSTAANATLNGRNAGTTQIYATDGGGAGYAGDTAAVAVQANIRMAQTGWYLNATDQVASQVLLSDPSPAGGTYVTFNYGTAGFAQVSPDPAFIPAGQLASNVVITALGSISGNTTITPVATGVNGAASTLYVYAPVLTISAGTSGRLGAGQFENGWYVYTPQTTSLAVPLTFTSTDTSVVTVAGEGGPDIPSGSYYRYFRVSGKAPGTALVIISATGWKPDTLAMTVTSPRTGICCTTTLNTTSPTQYLTVYARDSVGSNHYRTSSLALTISSSDTSVIRVLDPTPVIAAGAYYTNSIRYQPGGAGGTAWLKVVAGGHFPDSVLITVVGPKLEFSWSGTRYLGNGQYDQNAYVYAPNNVVSPLTVTLARSDTTKLTVPTTVTIPAGSYYAYFNIAGIDTAASVSVIASAPGYQGDTSYVRVTSPALDLTSSGTYNALGPGTYLYVYARDSVGTTHNRISPLAVSIVSRDTNIVKVDSATVTIAANQYYNGSGRMLPVSTGTTWIVVSAPGHRTDSSQFTVVTPKLNFSFTTSVLGRRQYYGTSSYYVYTPDNRTTPLAVTITQKNAAVDSLSSDSLTIPAASYYAYFGFAGMAVGTDTIIASASGYLPDTAYVRVSSPRVYASGMPATALTTSPQGSITLYAADSTNNSHYSLDTLVLHVTSSDTTVIKPAQRTVRIPRGTYYTYTYHNYFGPGTASLTFTDSAGVLPSITTGTVTVTGPSLAFSSGSTMLGMRQTTGSSSYYIYTQNNVVSAVTVNLVSTDTRVATVPASVTIPAGSYYAYFPVTAQDTVGTIQIQATATGFGPAPPMTVQVTQPKFAISTGSTVRTTSGAQTITVYAQDANGTSHYTTEPVTVTLASSSGAVAAVDSLTVTIPAGAYYTQAARWTPVTVGTSQLSASDSRAAIYKYNTAIFNVSVVVPNVSFNYGTDYLGLGQYTDSWYVQSQDYLAAATTVALGHVGSTDAIIPSTTTIPAGSYYSYFRVIGSAIGTDTLTANIASPLHNPDFAYVVVDSGRVDALSNWPSASLAVGDSVLVTLYTRDPNGTARNVLAATTFAISAGSGLEIRQGNAVVTSVTVPASSASVQFYVKATAVGTPSATFTNANYRTYTPPNVTVIP